MRFERLDLIACGLFDGQSFALPEREPAPDFYVFYGPNEAGKSSLLHAISALLFGFEERTPQGYRVGNAALRVGACITGEGRKLEFVRYKRRKNSLLDPAGVPLDGEQLTALLAGVSPPQFQQLFGLDHDALKAGGAALLKGGGGSSILFEAGGLLGIQKSIDELEEKARALFSPSASKPPVNAALAAWREARRQAQAARIRREEVEAVYARRDAAQAAVEESKARSKLNQQEIFDWQRMQNNRVDVQRLHASEDEMRSLGEVRKLDGMAKDRRLRAEATLRNAGIEVEQLRRSMAAREQVIEELSDNRSLLACELQAGELLKQVGAFRQSSGDIGKRRQEAARADEEARRLWRQAWPDRPFEEAESLRPIMLEIKPLRSLIGEEGQIASLEQNLAHRSAQAGSRLERLQQAVEDAPEPPPFAALRAAVEAARALGDIEDRCREHRLAADRISAAIDASLRALPGWNAGLLELERLPVPLAATLARFVADAHALAEERRALQAQLSAADQSVDQLRTQLEAATLAESVPSAAELAAARQDRDRLWSTIAAFAFTGRLTREQAQSQAESPDLAAAFQTRVAAADGIADRRFDHAAAISETDTLRRQMDSQLQVSATLRSQLAALDARLDALQARWRRQWPSTAPDLPPGEAGEWLQRRQRLLEMGAELQAECAEADRLRLRMDQARSELSARLSDAGEAALAGESMAALLQRASQRAQELSQAGEQRKESIRQLHEAESAVAALQQEAQALQQRRFSWSEGWASAVQLLGESDPARVEAILNALQSVFRAQDEHRQARHRVEAIQADLDRFQQAASRLMAQTGESFEVLSPNAALDQAVESLNVRIAAARKAATQREIQERELSSEQAKLAEAIVREQQAAAELQALAAEAGVQSAADLPRAEQASERQAQLEAEHKLIREGILSRNSGRSLAKVEAECAGIAAETISANLLAAQNDAPHFLEQLENATTQLNTANQELDALDRKANAAAASQAEAAALARIREGAEQYVRLKLCTEVLKRAMEAYRKKNQGPILAAAAAHFRRMTAGEHTELLQDFDESGEPVLKSLRRDGERVTIPQMSDGTRDQLFLALRLAIIAQRALQTGPFPLILDDVLVTSDMDRAAAILGELASFAASAQVLLFTNNVHIAQLAVSRGAARIDVCSDAAKRASSSTASR